MRFQLSDLDAKLRQLSSAERERRRSSAVVQSRLRSTGGSALLPSRIFRRKIFGRIAFCFRAHRIRIGQHGAQLG
jgi:hypothetical protein